MSRTPARMACLVAVILGVASCSSPDRSPPRPAPPTATADPTASLANLPFSQFVDQAFLLIEARFPQSVTFHGLAERLGTRSDMLDDYSQAYRARTADLVRGIASRTGSYDRALLAQDEKITYDAWMNYLHGAEFGAFSDEPLAMALYLGEACTSLRLTLSVFHPFRTAEDVEDYLARLASVDAQLDQLLGILDLAVSEGGCPSRQVVIAPVSELVALRTPAIGSHIFYRTLTGNLHRVPSMTPASRREYLERARAIVVKEVIPAADRFCDRLIALSGSAPEWGWAGDDDYDHAVGRWLGLEFSSDEVHDMALAEADRRKAELLKAAETVSLSMAKGIDATLNEVVQQSTWFMGDKEIAGRYAELIDELRAATAGAFRRVPEDPVGVTVSNDIVTCYIASSIDGSRHAQLLSPYTGQVPGCLMRRLASHEVYPGHHLQRVVARDASLPLVRRIGRVLGFTEGWASYAERLAREAGVYREDPGGLLGELWAELELAVAAVVDTGIHGLGWSAARAAAYVVRTLEQSEEDAMGTVALLAATPGAAIPYFVGQMKFLELRSRAQTELGARFNLPEFHDVVLREGVIPLSTLEQVVDDYIARASADDPTTRSEP